MQVQHGPTRHYSALVAASEALAALLDHQDADRRPSPETWSAAEYAQHVCEVTQALLAYDGGGATGLNRHR